MQGECSLRKRSFKRVHSLEDFQGEVRWYALLSIVLISAL